MGSGDLVTGISYSPGVWATQAGHMCSAVNATGQCSCQSGWIRLGGICSSIYIWMCFESYLKMTHFTLQAVCNVLPHRVHIWASYKHFTPTSALLSYSLFLPCICFSATRHLLWFLSVFSLCLHLLALPPFRSHKACECFNVYWTQAQSSMYCSSTLAWCVCVSCACEATYFPVF